MHKVDNKVLTNAEEGGGNQDGIKQPDLKHPISQIGVLPRFCPPATCQYSRGSLPEFSSKSQTSGGVAVCDRVNPCGAQQRQAGRDGETVTGPPEHGETDE
ncbi:hypothetical protein EYF80_031873 [Liparis tanakae]|uniref:Uncharacterized protein n=1 Tax=Liparis tanakae TaxID=230148 RepID=A0A4Z2GWC8_9TELE|nr:hypothetical protein EYF80_031873 [Liparis tanakae]